MTIKYSNKQLLKKFKHAADFGLTGDFNPQRIPEWKNALEAHRISSETLEIMGTFRGRQVIHYFDPKTKLNAIYSEDKDFITAWKLSTQQIQQLETTGNLGGG
ncbi:colicin D domain-containing protein [Brunnivagina elsteri]|uniref:Colicin D C-terminal domain-containing protein n=1 Tax=Brunnivagina elsteri CCALA 953 TaxID=987040 RepID=A0A2A2TEH2_9CYAN|nr:colicin D domain-containing protein [Calothrix elsteri]PAX52025.1 hypothetical protein CK510_21550 [Calothrix elsteri CCALA 953]